MRYQLKMPGGIVRASAAFWDSRPELLPPSTHTYKTLAAAKAARTKLVKGRGFEVQEISILPVDL